MNTQKPPIGATIDWSHPLAQGLVGCWMFNEGGGIPINIVSGVQATIAGTPPIYTTEGIKTNDNLADTVTQQFTGMRIEKFSIFTIAKQPINDYRTNIACFWNGAAHNGLLRNYVLDSL
jgi:hypothetical protein